MSGAEVDGTMAQGLCQYPGSISGLVTHTAVVTSEVTSLLRPQFPHLQTRVWARQWEGPAGVCIGWTSLPVQVLIHLQGQ